MALSDMIDAVNKRLDLHIELMGVLGKAVTLIDTQVPLRTIRGIEYEKVLEAARRVEALGIGCKEAKAIIAKEASPALQDILNEARDKYTVNTIDVRGMLDALPDMPATQADMAEANEIMRAGIAGSGE